QGARIGTSAPRRAAQMLHLRPDCSIVSFRGNVATRLERLERGEADVTLLAAAGLIRLDMADIGAPLGAAAWLPAPAQGAIGPECSFVAFRGNAAARLERLERGAADVALFAAAGLIRLDMAEIGAPLDAADWRPAPAQGAIGIECNAEDAETRALLASIDHAPS